MSMAPKPPQLTSGMGKEAVLPDELRGWNWGAFLLNWIWGLGNSAYIALLMFIPLVNVVMPFVLGAKGNQWAWANRPWRDVDHFRREQRNWARAGLIVIVLFMTSIAGLVAGVTSLLSNSDAHAMVLERVRGNSLAVKALGEPIESGWFVSGEISISGPKGKANLSIPVYGPKGEGVVYVSAVRVMGKWRILKLILDVPRTGGRFNLNHEA